MRVFADVCCHTCLVRCYASEKATPAIRQFISLSPYVSSLVDAFQASQKYVIYRGVGYRREAFLSLIKGYA